MSNGVHHDVMQGLTELLDRSRITGLCANCNGPIEGELHLCDPDKAGQVLMSSAWRYLLDGNHPMKRACSYRVS